MGKKRHLINSLKNTMNKPKTYLLGLLEIIWMLMTCVKKLSFVSTIPSKNLNLNKKNEEVVVVSKERKKIKYTPLSKRKDRPDSILWLVKNFTQLSDGQIAKLVGITKNSVTNIYFKNSENLLYACVYNAKKEKNITCVCTICSIHNRCHL